MITLSDGKYPAGVLGIVKTLQNHNFQAYIVGGSVRDLLLGNKPTEWDIATSAKPAEVGQLFDKIIPIGLDFGTVMVILADGQYELTTFRADEQYLDGRHPSKVTFTNNLHQDLARRDFTINALAYDPFSQTLVDDFGGQADLQARIIKAVGDPLHRFTEDGLRPFRACRFAAKLEFQIEAKTFTAISHTLIVAKKVAPERLHDELIKLLSADKPSIGFELFRQSGLLAIIMPELEKCFGTVQPPEYHPWDVYWHSLYSCDAAPANNYIVRLASLLHDIGKPSCQVDYTFYNHDKAGKEIAETILRRLKFSNHDIDQITNLISHHMFDYNNQWSDAAVRRFLRRIGGVDNIPALFALRRADTQAMHQKVGLTYLQELQQRIDKIVAEANALHITDLKIDGNDIMGTLKLTPGPKIGEILNDLLEKVLDDPTLNERSTLLKMIGDYA